MMFPIPSHDPMTGEPNPEYPPYACLECCQSNSPWYYEEERQLRLKRGAPIDFKVILEDVEPVYGMQDNKKCSVCEWHKPLYSTSQWIRPEFYYKETKV